MNKSSVFVVFVLCANAFLLFVLTWGISSVAKAGGDGESGLEIVFFAGGSMADSFAPVVAKGALIAGKHLGCKVRIVWSQWDVDKMVRQFKDELEGRPDAICMMGHPGMDRLGSLIKEARRKNIVVTLQNVDIPELRERYHYDGTGYVGQDLQNSGRMLADGMIREFGLMKGQVAIVFQSYPAQQETRGQRGDGAVEALRKQGLAVHSINTPYAYALDSTSSEARAFIRQKLLAIPDVKVIINDGILDNGPVIDELKAMRKRPGDIKYGTFDLSRSSVEHLKSGYVSLVHDQQPFLQGYYSVLQAYMAKKYRFSGLRINTGVSLINANTLPDIESLFESRLR